MRSSDYPKNRSFRKEVILALLLVVLTIASGFLIQVLLQIQANRRAEHRAGLLMVDTLEEFSAYAWNEQARRATAAERLADLPETKQKRLDDLQLDLLTIVSAASPMQEGYVPKLDTVIEEYQLDARCASVCWDMMQDCRAENAGFPMICSAYRTQEFQQELFDNKVVRVMQERYCTIEEASALAAEEVAYPGTSEHQLGLCADIMDSADTLMNAEETENMPLLLWLKSHCADYGFVLRYPKDKQEITGWYEPWHFRYVGKEAAAYMTEHNICLEELIAMF